MNKCMLIGNLTRDPETRVTANGIPNCTFSIAVSRRYLNANRERESDFFNIVTWRGLAETCGKYLAKGRKVAIVGSLQTRSYEAQDGSRRYVTEIVADEVEFLTPRSAAGEGGYDAPPAMRAPSAGGHDYSSFNQSAGMDDSVDMLEVDDTLPF